MPKVKLGRKQDNALRKQCCTEESVIQELKEKMSRLKFRLFDSQNKNQMLRKELLHAKKVVTTEVSPPEKSSFRDLLKQATNVGHRGRREKILLLKGKLNELQNRIKELEDSNIDKSPEDSSEASTGDTQPAYTKFRSKHMVDKELQYLMENSCQLKRKLEVWKKRNAEQSKEIELLRLELEKLLEKSKEGQHVHLSIRSVEKELRARQNEKLDMRSKLEVERTRNEQLAGEVSTVKDDISLILSKINDDKVLIEALKSQQGNLHDLLDRQKLISESDNRRFKDDLREIQSKHATNNNTLSYLHDVVEEKDGLCSQLQEYLKQKEQKYELECIDGETSTVTNLTNESEQSQETESQQPPSPANDAANGLNQEIPARGEEEIVLTEECENHKNILHSMQEEINQMHNAVSSNDERLNDWTSQLLQSKSLFCQKNAEVRDLEEVSKRLQKSCGAKKRCPSPQFGLPLVEEMQKKNDVLNEEYQYLLSLWQLLLSNKENSMDIYAMSVDSKKWLFIEALDNLISSENDGMNLEESPATVEDEEKSEPN